MLGLGRSAQQQGVRFGLPWLRFSERLSYRKCRAFGETEDDRWARKRDRDVEKIYSTSEFVAKLRRLADALEAVKRFEIQVAGERIYVPARADFNVEHER